LVEKMKKYLQKRLEGQTLTTNEATEALLKIGNGDVNPAQIAAFLTTYALKQVSVDELEGFREAMLQLAVPIDLTDFDAMDVCGTGGDGKDTFNISTTSAFVIAGAGQTIAKHGNHGVSSAVGSSTVLEHLGVKFSNDPEYLKQKLQTAGICYMHAPLFHPAMRHVGGIRKELGFKTFFNMLGPLLNPAKVQKQITGTYNLEVADLFAQLFNRSNATFGIIHALDGYDEISLTGDFQLITRTGKQIVSPAFLGLKQLQAQTLSGGQSLEDSAKIMVDILENKGTEAQTQVVLANAGVAIAIAQNIILDDAIAQAKESIVSGKALNCLKKLAE
jgi:anthranilate phosphoribosyltransferase